MGRPSKGERDQITAKPAKPLGMVIRANADLLHMSYGDYLVHLAAHQLGMPELAPQPGVTGDMLEELLVEPFPQVDQVAPVSPLALVRPSLRELPTPTQIAS